MPENCAAIVIAAKHHELFKVKDTRGTTKTVGALRCKFDFRTNDWKNSAKTAMFCNGNVVLHPELIDSAIAVPLDNDNECSVPCEVLEDTLPYSIGVWGVTSSGLRIVSNWLVFNAQFGCYTQGNAPEEPELTVYDEIRLISQEAVDAANSVVARADNGELDGKSAYELAQEEGFEGTQSEWLSSLVGAPGKDGVNGEDGYTPVKGVDYIDGKDGADGYTPIKGVDYFDGADGISVLSVTQTTTSTEDGGNNVIAVKLDNGSVFDFVVKNGSKGEVGDKGEQGDSGVYIGTEPPEDEDVIWIDSGATAKKSKNQASIVSINNGITVIDKGLTYSRGLVEVRRVGDILWIHDSGVYDFTADFATSKNRTVLQFDLPKKLSDRLPNVNGVYGTTGTIGYFPALAYENVSYTTFNCQSYIKRTAIGTDADTFQVVYTGLSAISGGGLCGFHLKMPLILIETEDE